jgi:hypothetical protein
MRLPPVGWAFFTLTVGSSEKHRNFWYYCEVSCVAEQLTPGCLPAASSGGQSSQHRHLVGIAGRRLRSGYRCNSTEFSSSLGVQHLPSMSPLDACS